MRVLLHYDDTEPLAAALRAPLSRCGAGLLQQL